MPPERISALEDGGFFSDNRITGSARVHMGHVFRMCNHDLLADFNAVDQAKIVRKALFYHAMDNRKAHIENAEPETLAWVWNTILPEWLRSGEPLFWITGKPASGKSTLMKYLAQNTETISCLSQTNSNWLVLHFYFDFRAGKGLPNSPLGLFRSLLDQLIERRPEIADQIYAQKGHRLEDGLMDLLPEVQSILLFVLKELSQSVCIFVDGLDEYQGSLADLARCLLSLSKQSGIKLCLASRPENALRIALGAFPTLVMQQWNEESIHSYFDVVASNTLNGSELDYFRSSLLPRIIDDARGVILWARFAIDEIYDALISGATSTELNDIFEDFPPDLEAVYERIIQRSSPKMKPQAALLLALMEATDERGLSPYIEAFNGESNSLREAWFLGICETRLSSDTLSQFTDDQFRYRVHAMLGGLAEFSNDAAFGTTRLNLCHKSVSTFLLRKNWIYEMLPEPLKSLYPTQLWAYLSTKAVIDASRCLAWDWRLVNDRHTWISTVNEENRLQSRQRIDLVLRDTQTDSQIRFLTQASEFEAHFLRSLDADYNQVGVARLIDTAIGCTLMDMYLSDIDFKDLQHWPSFKRNIALAAMFGIKRCFLCLYERNKSSFSLFETNQVIGYSLRAHGRFKFEQTIFDALMETVYVDSQHVAIYVTYDVFVDIPRFIQKLLDKPTSRISTSVSNCPWIEKERCTLIHCWFETRAEENNLIIMKRKLQVLVDLGVAVDVYCCGLNLYDRVMIPWVHAENRDLLGIVKLQLLLQFGIIRLRSGAHWKILLRIERVLSRIPNLNKLSVLHAMRDICTHISSLADEEMTKNKAKKLRRDVEMQLQKLASTGIRLVE